MIWMDGEIRMTDIEKVIEQLKQLEHCITKKCDITCQHYKEDILCPCNYDVSADVVIENTFQTIRELQEQNSTLWKAKEELSKFNNFCKSRGQISKWHLCSDEDLPNNNGDYLCYVIDDYGDYYYSVEPFKTDGFLKQWSIVSDIHVIAWMELPKFEEKKTCFDCKNHMMSDCYLECRIQNRINNDEICEKFERVE